MITYKHNGIHWTLLVTAKVKAIRALRFRALAAADPDEWSHPGTHIFYNAYPLEGTLPTLGALADDIGRQPDGPWNTRFRHNGMDWVPMLEVTPFEIDADRFRILRDNPGDWGHSPDQPFYRYLIGGCRVATLTLAELADRLLKEYRR